MRLQCIALLYCLRDFSQLRTHAVEGASRVQLVQAKIRCKVLDDIGGHLDLLSHYFDLQRAQICLFLNVNV